jgi:hypothetical protein
MSTMSLGRFECEMCGERRCRTEEDTVCHLCDKDMKAEERMALATVVAAWGSKKRCRSCDGPLPLDRYYRCHKCEKPSDRETACPYGDMLPDLSDLETTKLRAAPIAWEHPWRTDKRATDDAEQEKAPRLVDVQSDNLQFSVDAFVRALESQEGWSA